MDDKIRHDDIKSALEEVLNTSGQQDRSDERDQLKECLVEVTQDPIVASFVDHFPMLLREDLNANDFIIRKLKCDLSDENTLGSFHTGLEEDSPQIKLNLPAITKFLGSHAIYKNERKIALKTVLIKELLRGAGLRDDVVAEQALKDCIARSELKSALSGLNPKLSQNQLKPLPSKSSSNPSMKVTESIQISQGQATTQSGQVNQSQISNNSSEDPSPAAASASAKLSVGETYDQQRPVEFPKEIRASDMPNPGSPNFGRAVVSLVREQLIAPALA
ncbi:MAG: hypothetical protein ACK5RO_07730, partial [Pseudobdellovibrionaceae bacterium]